MTAILDPVAVDERCAPRHRSLLYLLFKGGDCYSLVQLLSRLTSTSTWPCQWPVLMLFAPLLFFLSQSVRPCWQ
jgi:hypothetical protein